VTHYCRRFAGREWLKSTCGYCGFSKGRPEIQARWRAYPDRGADVLVMELVALALNPLLPLYVDKTAHRVITQAEGMGEVLVRYALRLASCPWACYRVRRCRSKKAWDRSVERLVVGTQAEASAHLGRVASEAGVEVEVSAEGIERAWLRRRTGGRDAAKAEEMLSVAPAAAQDKARPWFEKSWRVALRMVG
jgi:hypothetical protein